MKRQILHYEAIRNSFNNSKHTESFSIPQMRAGRCRKGGRLSFPGAPYLPTTMALDLRSLEFANAKKTPLQ